MSRNMSYGEDARAHLLRGISKLTDAVKTTLGPAGRNVMIDKDGIPHCTKDGVTVAKAFHLKDRNENMGAQIVKEASSKTADQAGDGTTTATVLTHAMIVNGMELINEHDTNPIDIKRGMDLAVECIEKKIDELSKPIKNTKDIEQVATISGNNDPKVGKVIADAMEIVGQEGIISVENGETDSIVLDVKEGMEFERGYLSPYFINETRKNIVEFNSPYILVTTDTLSIIQDVMYVLEQVQQTGRPLLIIADDVEQQALSTLIVNKMKGHIKVAAIKAPGIGEYKRDILEDICYLTGANLFDKQNGSDLSKCKLDNLGEAMSITITKDKTTIIDGQGDKEMIEDRIKQITSEMETETSNYRKESLETRRAKLGSGVVMVKVGAPTEGEQRELRDRVDDALAATKSAVEDGIVIGGGCALLNCVKVLDELKAEHGEDECVKGIQVVIDSLSAPAKNISINAGKNGEEIVRNILSHDDVTIGYNAKTDMYEDLVETGVIDPAKVVKQAIKNSASSAGTILLTECLMAHDVADGK